MFASKLKIKEFKKGDVLIAPCSTQTEIFFLIEGVQYSYWQINNKKHVIAFFYPPGFSVIPASFNNQLPTHHTIECLTNGKMFCLSFDDFQLLLNQSRQIETLSRKLLEVALFGFIDRYLELHSLSIEQRYIAFCKRSPQLLNLIPHKYIASYLNIDSTNFSKLFNTIII
ncbi:MAG: Crp/Fnr family transcriptional regulator [Bacteroidetes bacterium]|nr:Crp/Fnr family transcriptional regulator [Bacteroidota bacterium]